MDLGFERWVESSVVVLYVPSEYQAPAFRDTTLSTATTSWPQMAAVAARQAVHIMSARRNTPHDAATEDTTRLTHP
jgi:hypothetical protein